MINTLANYYKNKYGFRVFKLGLSTGIECPKRSDSCSFCVQNTFIDEGLKNKNITQQIDYLIEKISKKVKAGGFIAYFQDNTSSFGELDYLFSLFSEADNHPQILEIIISTRPDYISVDFLEMLKNIKKPITIEIGMQSANDKSLIFLNRGHSQKDTEQALKLIMKFSYRIGVHIILGIPDETIEDIQNTLDFINKNECINDVKIHHLAVFEGSKLATLGIKGISLDEYIEILNYFLQRLREDITVSRLFTSNLNRNQTMLNDFPGVKRIWMNKFIKKYIPLDKNPPKKKFGF